jgi:hypothetical protein
MLGEFVAATAPRPPPPPPFKGYDPVFEAHYPKFYKVLYKVVHDFSFSFVRVHVAHAGCIFVALNLQGIFLFRRV